MIGSNLIIPPQANPTTSFPATGSTEGAYSQNRGDANSTDDFKALMDRRLNAKRASRNSERDTERAATSKIGNTDGRATSAASASQTNADMGMQGAITEWTPIGTLDLANSGDADQTAGPSSRPSIQLANGNTCGILQSPGSAVPCDSVKPGADIPSNVSSADVLPKGNAPRQGPSGQIRSLSSAAGQTKLAPDAPDDGETDGKSTPNGQKLPTTDVLRQAVLASRLTGLPSPGNSPSTETSGLQASTTSEDSQNALGTTVASVSEVMKSNKSSELRSGGLGSLQPGGTVDKASPMTNPGGESSVALCESGRLMPTGVATALDDVPQTTRGAILETVLHGVSDQVLEFKRLGADSMAVLLKPDDKTEIYLNVSSQSGHVEVSARLNTGDADLLNSHWGEIKSSLAKQGIALSDLDSDDARHHYGSTSSGGRQDQSPDPQSETPQRRSPSRREMTDFISNIKSLTDPLAKPWVGPAALAAAKRLWVMWI